MKHPDNKPSTVIIGLALAIILITIAVYLTENQ